LFTMEGRYYTEWYPFRLFRIGAAGFYDMGRAWGGEYANPDSGVLRDFGAGLRIALARSGHGGVVHVDVAFPIDGDPSIARVQFLVKTKVGF
jgi:hemolysin activation/secretion protein